MNNQKKLLLGLFLLGCLLALFLSINDKDKTLPLKNEFPQSNVAFIVIDRESGKLLTDYNSSTFFIPASITKLFTAEAALEKWGGGHRFKTAAYITGPVEKGAVQGNLILEGGGDPLFETKDLEKIAHQIRLRGIYQIKGGVKILDEPKIHSHLEVGDLLQTYSPVISKLSLNQNKKSFYLIPGNKGKAELAAAPSNIISRVDALTDEKQFKTPEFTSNLFDKEWILEGAIVNPVEVKIPILFLNPYITEEFQKALKSEGIDVLNEKVIDNEKVEAAYVLSEPVEKMVEIMLKDSDNLIAEVLGLSLNGEMEKYSEKYSSKFMDKSGGSRHNRLTALSTVQFLKDHPRLEPLLPLSGIEGTLKNRFKNSPLEKRIRAKTGALDQVTNLAGFATLKDGRKVIFALFINQSPFTYPETAAKLDTFLIDNL